MPTESSDPDAESEAGAVPVWFAKSWLETNYNRRWVTLTLLPGTIRVWSIGGGLSRVLTRTPMGPATADLRRKPSLYPAYSHVDCGIQSAARHVGASKPSLVAASVVPP
jgi:hypothetical protein